MYAHIKRGGEVFYIGIGNSKRPFNKTRRSIFWKNVVTKYDYDILILRNGLTEETAKQVERYYVSLFGRRDLGTGTLVNLTAGGDGILNPSSGTRDKLKRFFTGRKCPPRTEANCKANSKGKTGIKNPMFGRKSPRAREIVGTSKAGVDIVFPNSYEAAKYVLGQANKVIACCKNKRPTHKQFTWRYKTCRM